MDCLARICILSMLSAVITIHRNVNADQNTFNVVDYGAVGDGKSDDSLGFIKAWNNTCNAKEGTPTMIIPKGKTFLVPPITFSGPCKSTNIYIKLAGTIKAPNGPSAWKAADKGAWLVFKGITGLNINGFGKIDGNGQNWWGISCRYHPGEGCNSLAPTALSFRQCKNVHVAQIYVVRSPQSHILVLGCEYVTFKSLIIRSPETSPNTDGIHISNSRNVFVLTSIIGTGDDCVSIGDHASNVRVSYVKCGPGHGISIGSLGRDGNVVEVENIAVEHISFYKTTNGARIKTWQVGRGRVQHVKFSDLTFTAVENPIIIDQYYCDIAGACKSTSTGVHINDLRYQHLSGTSATRVAMNFNCSSNVACTNISLEDIQLKSATRGERVISSCNNAYGVARGIVEPKSCLSQKNLLN